jgi:hypothetical protein
MHRYATSRVLLVDAFDGDPTSATMAPKRKRWNSIFHLV